MKRDREIVIRTSAIAAALAGMIANRLGLQGHEQLIASGLGIVLAEAYDRAMFAFKQSRWGKSLGV